MEGKTCIALWVNLVYNDIICQKVRSLTESDCTNQHKKTVS